MLKHPYISLKYVEGNDGRLVYVLVGADLHIRRIY